MGSFILFVDETVCFSIEHLIAVSLSTDTCSGLGAVEGSCRWQRVQCPEAVRGEWTCNERRGSEGPSLSMFLLRDWQGAGGTLCLFLLVVQGGPQSSAVQLWQLLFSADSERNWPFGEWPNLSGRPPFSGHLASSRRSLLR